MLAQASMQRSRRDGALDKARLVSKFFEQPQHYSELSRPLFLGEARGMQEKDREREKEGAKEREKKKRDKEGQRRGKGRGKEAGEKESAGGSKRESGRNALTII